MSMVGQGDSWWDRFQRRNTGDRAWACSARGSSSVAWSERLWRYGAPVAAVAGIAVRTKSSLYQLRPNGCNVTTTREEGCALMLYRCCLGFLVSGSPMVISTHYLLIPSPALGIAYSTGEDLGLGLIRWPRWYTTDADLRPAADHTPAARLYILPTALLSLPFSRRYRPQKSVSHPQNCCIPQFHITFREIFPKVISKNRCVTSWEDSRKELKQFEWFY